MALKNQRGETLIETVVSMSILATLLLCVFVILLFSSRATKYSLEIISGINQEIADIHNGSYDGSAVDSFNTKITVKYDIKGTGGEPIKESPTDGYTVNNNMPVIITEKGLIVLGWIE